MSTTFNVSIDNVGSFTVSVSRDNYEAHAIVLIESLKAFTDMSHKEAIDAYTNATKQVREDSFGIENLIRITDSEPVDTPDLQLFDIDRLTDKQFDLYWRGEEYNFVSVS